VSPPELDVSAFADGLVVPAFGPRIKALSNKAQNQRNPRVKSYLVYPRVVDTLLLV
jgi:hypothetical protein